MEVMLLGQHYSKHFYSTSVLLCFIVILHNIFNVFQAAKSFIEGHSHLCPKEISLWITTDYRVWICTWPKKSQKRCTWISLALETCFIVFNLQCNFKKNRLSCLAVCMPVLLNENCLILTIWFHILYYYLIIYRW